MWNVAKFIGVFSFLVIFSERFVREPFGLDLSSDPGGWLVFSYGFLILCELVAAVTVAFMGDFLKDG